MAQHVQREWKPAQQKIYKLSCKAVIEQLFHSMRGPAGIRRHLFKEMLPLSVNKFRDTKTPMLGLHALHQMFLGVLPFFFSANLPVGCWEMGHTLPRNKLILQD
eukprot:325799-Amphidinium_carterae.1